MLSHRPCNRRGLRAGQAILAEHVGHLGLRLARALVDLAALVDDLCLEDLALALARQVFAGGHAEDAGQPRRDAGNEDREAARRGAGHRAHDREGADQAVLCAEDRLTDLAEQARTATLVAEMGAQELGLELVGGHAGPCVLVLHQLRVTRIHRGHPQRRRPTSSHAAGRRPAASATFRASQGMNGSAPFAIAHPMPCPVTAASTGTPTE